MLRFIQNKLTPHRHELLLINNYRFCNILLQSNEVQSMNVDYKLEVHVSPTASNDAVKSYR